MTSMPAVADAISRGLCIAVAGLWLMFPPAAPAIAMGTHEAATSAPSESRAVNRLFSQWARPSSPGAVVAIIQDGRIVYSRGYGMASLEYGIPNTPRTVFNVASVSKQFTAFCIYLLAKDGKLSLNDDVRKYVPELHDFGKTITLRHLIQHTSGVRDWFHTLALTGWRLDDGVTDEDVTRLLFRQTELNFAPGEKFLYSNSGYTLLALVVRRVSGMSLPEFAKRNIFDPLHMTHSHFKADYSEVVKNQAYSYVLGDDGKYEYSAVTESTPGPGDLYSTVEDLALWDRNFYTATVGGKELLSEMQEIGKLNGGQDIPYDYQLKYASGLYVGKYRGLNIVGHNGQDAGYKTNIMRFPDQRFSVIVLGNASDIKPMKLSWDIADIYLKDKFLFHKDETKSNGPEIPVDPATLDRYVGDYELSPGFLISFTRDGDQFFVQGTGQFRHVLYATSKNTFHPRDFDADFTFEDSEGSEKAQSALGRQDGKDYTIKRIGPLPADQLKAFEGRFYSEELGVIYDVADKDGALMVDYPRGEMSMKPAGENVFVGDFPLTTVRYTCTPAGTCSSFTVSNLLARKVRFEKVPITPVETH